MNRLRFLVLGLPLSSIVLGACSAGPDYERLDPRVLVPDEWQAQGELADASLRHDLDLVEWWQSFEDRELTRLIETSLRDGLDILEARERLVAARARRGIENANRLPTLDGSVGYERVGTGPQGLVLGGAPPGATTDVYSVGVVAGWEADLFGRVGRLVEAADREIEVATEDLRAARVALAAELAREVFTVRTLDQELAIVESSVATDRETLEINKARARAGLSDELDASRAERVLQSDLAELERLRSDRRSTELRIAVLVGATPGSVQIEVAPLPRRDLVPERGVPADLLVRRPDVRRDERRLAATTARIGAREAERYPRITLSGSVALQGPDAGDVLDLDAYAFRAGPSITIPLLDGGRIEANVQVAESDRRRALIGLRRTVLNALSEVEVAVVQRARAERQAGRLSAAETAARDTERLSEDRYRAGAVDFLDVIEARIQRLSIERQRLGAERAALIGLVDLYAALGGGWSPADGLGPDPVAATESPGH